MEVGIGWLGLRRSVMDLSRAYTRGLKVRQLGGSWYRVVMGWSGLEWVTL